MIADENDKRSSGSSAFLLLHPERVPKRFIKILCFRRLNPFSFYIWHYDIALSVFMISILRIWFLEDAKELAS